MGDLSRAWKYSAKIYRDFYNLTMTQAKKWKGRYYKSQKENQRLRKALKDFNWSHYDTKQGDHYCLICDANKADGKHKPDCPMEGVE